MIYSDTATNSGIVQLVRRLTNTDDNTYEINDLTADINTVYADYISIILSSDTRWQWDDANFTTFPIATTDIVALQRDYQFNTSFLKILKVLIQPQTPGDFIVLDETDLMDDVSNLDAWAMNVDSTSNIGQPAYFDLIGDSIRLQPRPNYSSTGGLKVYFQRYESPFVPTDTTKEPGFPHPFHMGLAYGAAHLFAISHNLPQTDRIAQKDMECRDALQVFFSERNKAERPRIIMRNVNSK